METSPDDLIFLYDNLIVETISYLEKYINSGRGDLATLKDRFRQTLPRRRRRRVKTVKQLVKALEDQGVLGINDVKLLKLLAVKLGIDELVEKIVQFETDCCGK
jgi:hypothetical protein